jgi:hypothetical protein
MKAIKAKGWFNRMLTLCLFYLSLRGQQITLISSSMLRRCEIEAQMDAVLSLLA